MPAILPQESYVLGVDIGTTFTAAATHRGGRTEIATLGNLQPAMPTLVFLREDGELLVGEAAERRGLVEPHRLAREFKRRVGDDTPIMLGGSPYFADRLIAAVLRDVLAAVAAREGGEPDTIAVSHPANWGEFKTDVLRHACDLAGLSGVTQVTEPIAAAVHYSSMERLEPGAIVAVYDLGGGTFDAAVLKKTVDGFTTLGQPEGIERLGGIDFDAAVFSHVRQSLGGLVDDLDVDDPAVRAAVARLRQDCVAAKEALSFDTEATVPILLPNVQTQLRLTRTEFEAMIRPPLLETIEALRRALASAEVVPGDLAAVLLVGGSSRIPLVAETVTSELGRPVAVDVHPKHAVALGTALVAAGQAGDATAAPDPTSAIPVILPLEAGEPLPAPEPAPVSPPPADEGGRRRSRALLLAAAVIALVLIGGAALALTRGGDDSTDVGTTDTTVAPMCPSASGRCARITEIAIEDGTYVVRYETAGFDPVTFVPDEHGTPEDHHVLFFLDTTPPEKAGTEEPGSHWWYWDRGAGGGELVFTGYKVTDRGAAQRMCVLVADKDHVAEPNSGNCVDLPATPPGPAVTPRPTSPPPTRRPTGTTMRPVTTKSTPTDTTCCTETTGTYNDYLPGE